MWGWLGSLSQQSANASFPYKIGEERTSLSEKSIWKLHGGQKQADGTEVSIFIFDKTGATEDQVKLARASFFRLKTLRHPCILRYIDGVELDTKICVATEAVIPLVDYLEEQKATLSGSKLCSMISWGIHQIAKGIGFLNVDCNLSHSALCMASVFVDRGGAWKLGSVDYLHTIGEAQPEPVLPYFKKYHPPGSKMADVKVKWATDVWGLGCLLWEVFNGPLPQLSALKTTHKLPKTVVALYCELVSANARNRPNPNTFVANCSKPNGFMDNDFVAINLQLDEFQILDANEKETLFSKLQEHMDTFPECFQRHKFLPVLLQAFEFGEAGSAVLAPLFQLGKLLQSDDYQRQIVPCVVKLFSSTDRGTRINLLQQLDQFVEHLQPNIVNEKIFPHVALGFNDTVPVMREHTIKSMLLLAPKLSEKTMNGELLRHFAKLQMDEQPGIRTNTTICLGKLARHLNSGTRQKVLQSAFMRALKDPFPPARLASLRGMVSCVAYFSDDDLAVRLLPALCVLMVDKDKTVRDAVFEGASVFIQKLEESSRTRGAAAPDDASAAAAGVGSSGLAAGASAASWAGWAVTSLTSKIYKSDGTSIDGGAAAGGGAGGVPIAAQSQSSAGMASTTAQAKPPQPVATAGGKGRADSSRVQAAHSSVAGHAEADTGWDDDDDESWEAIEDSFTASAPAKKSAPSSSSSGPTKSNVGSSAKRKDSDGGGNESDGSGAWNDDDDWGSFGGSFDSPAAKKTTSTKGASTSNASTHASRKADSHQPPPASSRAKLGGIGGSQASKPAATSTKAAAAATTANSNTGSTVSGSAGGSSGATATTTGGGDGWGDSGDGWGDDDDDADWGTAIDSAPTKPAAGLGATKSKKDGLGTSAASGSAKAKKGAMSLSASKPTSSGSSMDGFVKDDSMPTAASLFADTSSSKSAAKTKSSGTAMVKPAAAAASAVTTTTGDGNGGDDGWGDTGDWGDLGDGDCPTARSTAATASPSSDTAAVSSSSTTAATTAEKNALREQRRAEQRKRQEAAKAKRAAAAGAGKPKLGGAMKLG
eukprot:scpid30799/ scgid7961/ N-terminal kinase-like protein; SCY1-like protein 1